MMRALSSFVKIMAADREGKMAMVRRRLIKTVAQIAIAFRAQ